MLGTLGVLAGPRQGCCPLRASGDSLPCERYSLTSLIGNKEGSMSLMVLRVRPTPTWFPTSIHYTPLDNTPLNSILSVWCPWSKDYFWADGIIVFNEVEWLTEYNAVQCLYYRLFCRCDYRSLQLWWPSKNNFKLSCCFCTYASYFNPLSIFQIHGQQAAGKVLPLRLQPWRASL